MALTKMLPRRHYRPTGRWGRWAASLPVVTLGVILHGIAWGVRGPLQHAVRAEYFGRASFGTLLGFSSMILMWGTMAGPIIPGVLADRTGSYHLGFTILAILAGAGSVLFILARRPTPPTRVSAAPAGPIGSIE